MHTVDRCPCGSRVLIARFSKWSRRIVECSACGMAFVNPRNVCIPRDDVFQLKQADPHAYETILRNLSTCIAPGRLLNPGCGAGHFLAYAQQRHWDPLGIEGSERAVNFGVDRLRVKVIASTSISGANLPESHYDACVMNEILEQFPDPKETLSAALGLLKPGGVLYLITPNWSSYRSLLRREQWSAIVPAIRHYYFTFQSLKYLLADLGFIEVMDLSQPANFESEIESARTSGTLGLNHRQLKSLRARIVKEDAGKLSNGRAENLVCWARKPQIPYEPVVALSRETGSRTRLEGRLVCGDGQLPEDRRVFLVRGGLKHWVTSVNWLKTQGLSLSDVVQVPASDLDCIIEGCPLSAS
jgi:SAM-dependent methyltransferase